MKDNTINIRASEEDQVDLQKAAENLSILTDKKPSISKTIRAGVKILAEDDPTKPTLFYVNRKALRDLDIHMDYAMVHLQAIYDCYLSTIGTPPTFEEIESWFGTFTSNFMVPNKDLIRESILQKKYLEQKALYPGLQFNYDNVILPDLESLNEIAGQLIFGPLVDRRETFFWNCYRIVKDKIELIPDACEAVKNAWRVYAISPDEKTRLAGIRKLCILMDSIRLSNPSAMNIPGFVIYDTEAGVYTPMEHYVKGYIK